MLGNRLVHMVVLTIFVAVAVLEPMRTVVPMWEYVLAVGVVLAWMLGQRHERAIIVEAGLADEREVRTAERESQTWFRNGTDE